MRAGKMVHFEDNFRYVVDVAGAVAAAAAAAADAVGAADPNT
jgi:hypothetical protein